MFFIKTLPTALLAAALLAAAPVQAQVAGTYAGTTSQGLPIEIKLVLDPVDGLVFTGNTTQWTEDCKTGDTKSAWWGVGAWMPVTGKKLTQTYMGQSLYQTLNMKFDVSGTVVSGTFKAGEATYVDVNTSTKQTEPCNTGTLTYTATLQPPSVAGAKRASLPAGAIQAHPLDR